MARITTNRYAARKGAGPLRCEKCGAEINKGDRYRWFKVGFRSRYKHIRCMETECTPRQSEMMTSKMAGVYAAIESAEDSLDALSGAPEDDVGSVRSILEEAASDIEGVADEYREAGEMSPTGLVFGEDYGEKADEISDAASELESWDADEDEPDYDSCDNDLHEEPEPDDEEDREVIERGNVDECESCAAIRQDWWDGVIEQAREALSEVQL